MELIGPVVRLQVQRSRLKPGPRGGRRYDPSPLLEVEALDVGPRGVVGDGVVDVHHADHPDTRHRSGGNGLSLMTTGAYEALRSRYGPRLADGVAGEGLLVDAPDRSLTGPLLLETTDGVLELTDVDGIPPCVEFSRWALGRDDLEVDDEVRAALESLGDGARGWYGVPAGTGRVVRGALLHRAERSPDRSIRRRPAGASAADPVAR